MCLTARNARLLLTWLFHVRRQLSLPVVLTHLRITLPGLVIPIQSSIVISNHLLTEGYFIFI